MHFDSRSPERLKVWPRPVGLRCSALRAAIGSLPRAFPRAGGAAVLVPLARRRENPLAWNMPQGKA